MDSNISKDATMNCTIISRVLDVVNEKRKSKGAVMPRTLSVGADNTAWESKNQCSQPTVAKLVALEKFEATYVEPRTGHTKRFQTFTWSST